MRFELTTLTLAIFGSIRNSFFTAVGGQPGLTIVPQLGFVPGPDETGFGSFGSR